MTTENIIPRTEVLRMARKAGSLVEAAQEKDLLWLERFAKLIAEHEREECAKYLEKMMVRDTPLTTVMGALGDAIRARGQE